MTGFSWPPEFPGDPRRPASPPQPNPQPNPLAEPLPATRVWLTPDVTDRLYERLLEKRIVLASGILDDEAATRLSAQLLTLDAEAITPIRLELQNLRAELPAALTVMGILDTLRAEVHANASGDIAGPALGVLASCHARSGYPNATFTFAEPKLNLGGALTASALAAREQQIRRMVDTLYYRIAEVAGRDAEEVRADARGGRTLTAAEALGYGLLTDRATRES
jgi:ATP-dependent Clp protease protease subunit